MFFKTRMRSLTRRIIAAAAPVGLRPDRRRTAERALLLERAALAYGLTWHGLSAAQAALLIIHAGRMLSGLGAAEADRLEAAATRFAATRGLLAFSTGIARDMARMERLAALRRHGHSRGWPLLA